MALFIFITHKGTIMMLMELIRKMRIMVSQEFERIDEIMGGPSLAPITKILDLALSKPNEGTNYIFIEFYFPTRDSIFPKLNLHAPK